MPGIPTIPSYPLPTAGDLPANIANWAPDASRAVLLIHDMQRYFLTPLAERLRAEVIRNVATVRERCVSLGVPVAYTAQPGRMTEDDRGLLRDFWGPGMRSTPADRLVVDELTPNAHDWMLRKWRYSAFIRSDLLTRMRDSGRDQLVLCGVYAHVGILATAIDAFSNDLRTFVVADAVADFSEAYHRMALTYAAERCAVVLTAKEVLR